MVNMIWSKINLNATLIIFQIIIALAFSSTVYYDDSPTNFENCICVPYWQCKDDHSGLIEDGLGIMDIRTLKSQYSTPCTGDYDVCCKMECGRQYVHTEVNTLPQRRIYKNILTNRIQGEENTSQFAEFPWMLGILENMRYICGASLIHPRVALTVAHCVCKTGVYTVRAGEWNWESFDEPVTHQDRITTEIIIHPDYEPVPLQNDIALLFLDSAFTITENVGVICLPPPMKTYDYSKCTATGWGRNPSSKRMYQSTLKKIDLPIVPNFECAALLRNKILNPYFDLHASFICAGGENKDTCKGDGGGPLFCQIAGQPHRYEQIGIVSWGLTCGTVNAPGVYVNVALFSDWIYREVFSTDVYQTR